MKLRRSRRQIMKPTKKKTMLRFRFPVWIFLVLLARDSILRARAYWNLSKMLKSTEMRILSKPDIIVCARVY